MHIFFLALMGEKTAVLFSHDDDIWWPAGICIWIIIIVCIWADPPTFLFIFFPVLRLNVWGFKEFKRVDYEAFGLTLSAEMTEKSIKWGRKE